MKKDITRESIISRGVTDILGSRRSGEGVFAVITRG